MAISKGTTTETSIVSNSLTENISHTVSGSMPGLVVTLWIDQAADKVTSVKWNGTPMTRRGYTPYPEGYANSAYIYTLTSPAVGSGSISVTFSSTGNYVILVASNFNGTSSSEFFYAATSEDINPGGSSVNSYSTNSGTSISGAWWYTIWATRWFLGRNITSNGSLDVNDTNIYTSSGPGSMNITVDRNTGGPMFESIVLGVILAPDATSINVSDTETITESITMSGLVNPVMNDSLTPGENISMALSYNIGVSDTVSILESVIFNSADWPLTIDVHDSPTITELVNVVIYKLIDRGMDHLGSGDSTNNVIGI